MDQIFKLFLFGLTFVLFSCASSMSPIEVSKTLPTLTKSKFISQVEAEKFIETDSCKYLVREREYVAPIGFLAKDDLKNGAKGIDDWVKLDGGNAYVLKNFKWITVDSNGTTELHLEFATLRCK